MKLLTPQRYQFLPFVSLCLSQWGLSFYDGGHHGAATRKWGLEGLGSVTHGHGETTTESTLGDLPSNQPLPLLSVQLDTSPGATQLGRHGEGGGQEDKCCCFCKENSSLGAHPKVPRYVCGCYLSPPPPVLRSSALKHRGMWSVAHRTVRNNSLASQLSHFTEP